MTNERENYLGYFKFGEWDHVPKMEMDPDNELRHVTVDTCVCERPMFSDGYDAFSVHWTDGHYTVGQKPIIEDIEDWRSQVRIPDVEKIDFTPARRSVEGVDRSSCIVGFTTMMGPFERMTTLTSYEDCLINCFSEPELFEEVVSAIADYKIALIRKLWEAARPDEIKFHDDYGSNQATLISPGLWRKIIKPHVKRIFDVCREYDMSIIHHCCGRVEALVPAVK